MKRITSQMYNLVCAKCERGDELTQDALCVWCQRCGPSYPVRAPRHQPGYLALSPEAPASLPEE